MIVCYHKYNCIMNEIKENKESEETQKQAKNMDIHGNLYTPDHNKVNGKSVCMEMDFNAHEKPEGCTVEIFKQTLYRPQVYKNTGHDGTFPIKISNKDISANKISIISDLTTKRRDLVSFVPAINKENFLSEPVDMNGVQLKIPSGAKINLNTVPIIQNEDIQGYKSYPTLEFDIPFKGVNYWSSKEEGEEGNIENWCNQEEGSIENILYNIIKSQQQLPYNIVIEKNRIISHYGNRLDVYDLQPDLKNPGKFKSAKKYSTEIDGFRNIAVINDSIFLYGEKDIQVCGILPDRIQLNTYIENDDFYSMQDFLNRTNLRDYTIMTREKYASMEKKYIEDEEKKKKEKTSGNTDINNNSTNTNLDKDKGGKKNEKCNIQ